MHVDAAGDLAPRERETEDLQHEGKREDHLAQTPAAADDEEVPQPVTVVEGKKRKEAEVAKTSREKENAMSTGSEANSGQRPVLKKNIRKAAKKTEGQGAIQEWISAALAKQSKTFMNEMQQLGKKQDLNNTEMKQIQN